MDTKTLFKSIGREMRADFEKSAEIKHTGSKGTVRENILRQFLAKGRLPEKYGLGSGEIVGRIRDTSRQSDLIVYDKLNGVTLLYDETVQVFPIDCVYGIIEVKSERSKIEFLDALEKIKVFRAILEAGVIYHHCRPFERCIDSDQITSEAWPLALSYGEDSLFQFFCSLHDICARMQLGPVELTHYYDPPVRIGRHVVFGRGVEGELVKPGTEPRKVRIAELTVDQVINWCAAHGRMRYGDVLKMRFGSIPMGMETEAGIDREVFLYNSNNLRGLHEMGPNPITMRDGYATVEPSLATAIELLIDGELYVIAALTDADYEPVGGA
jgi:hypothetical protein